jgi:hypothetical protein
LSNIDLLHRRYILLPTVARIPKPLTSSKRRIVATFLATFVATFVLCIVDPSNE